MLLAIGVFLVYIILWEMNEYYGRTVIEYEQRKAERAKKTKKSK
jgi:hypothetical protein